MAVLVAGAGCVDLTAPWEKPTTDATANATGGQTIPDGLGGGGVGGSGPVDVALAKDAAKGGSGGSIDGGGGPIDGSAIDVPSVADDGGIDAPMSDVAIDAPISGTGGAGLDGAVDVGAGGMSTGGSGGGTARGGSGGTATGGVTGRGGSGGTSTGTGTGGAVFACAGYVSPGGTSGPVASYACDETSGSTLTDAAGSRNGTLAADAAALDGGTAYAFGAGRVGNAVYFTAASKAYAALGNKFLMNSCEATVALWVYLNSAVDWQRIFDFGKNDQIYMFLTARNSRTNVLRFAISTTGNGSGEQTMDAQAALPTGAWHHVAVVLGPAGGVLYLDGAQVGANAAMTLRPADLGNIPNYYIGKSQFSWDPYLDGNVDEIRLYTRALSAAEIQALANGS